MARDSAGWNGEEFCVAFDDIGAVQSVEEGSLADVPTEILTVVRGIFSRDLRQLAFLWSEESAGAYCRVTIEIVPEGIPGAAMFVRGEPLYDLPYGLTRRELDIVTLLVIGLSNSDIAMRLWVSERTVTTHLERILKKLNVRSRTAAAVIALDQGLMRVPFPGGSEGFDLLRLGRALHPPETDTISPSPVTAMSPSRERPRPIALRPLRIGAALPLHGFEASDGIEMLRGTQLAIDEINQRGGIQGRKLDLEVVDVDITDAISTRCAFETLASREVDVITSGYFAHQNIAHQLAAEYGAPYLHAATLGAMERRVATESDIYGRIFQVCPSDFNYGPRYVSFLAELEDRGQWLPPSKRVLVIQSAWDLSDFGLDAASVIAEQRGWSLEMLRLPSNSPEAWEDAVQQVRKIEPAAVMLGHYLLDGTVTFLKSFLENPCNTLIYSLYAPSIPEFRTQMGASAEGVVWATVTGTYSDAVAQSFAAKFKTWYGMNPGRSHAGIAYDRARIIANAWQRSENPRDFGKVADELRSTIYRGVNGVYSFNTPGQSALTFPQSSVDPSLAQAHLVFQFQNGHHRILSPSPYADAQYVAPPWTERVGSAA
jgi:branched-chain amino acid transport system substrate-binding protein